MPTLTAQQDASRQAGNKVLVKLLKAPKTRQQLGCTRHQLLKLLDEKLIKRAGAAKNAKTGARKAVLYDLTAAGRKRAEKAKL